MALVVFKGTQYDTDRLPAHIKPQDCVPLDEWMRQNRTDRPSPVITADDPDGVIAEALERAQTAETKLAEAQARIAELEAAAAAGSDPAGEPPADPNESTEVEKDVDDMTIPELHEYAEKHDIAVKSSDNKSELLATIKAAKK